MNPGMIKVAILTISDSRNKDQDLSGKVINDFLDSDRFTVVSYDLVCDDIGQIKNKLIHYADELGLDLVLTTGGTGFGQRDLTPEATAEAINKSAPGIAELIRIEGGKKTPKAFLSRGVSGIRKNTLIVNLPGSPKGVKESLEAVRDIIHHAIDMIKGRSH